MATLNLGRIKPVFRGAYNNSTAYVVDDIVTSGGSSYICIQASTGNAVSNATYWTQMAAGGTDVGTTLTTQGDILYRDGSGLQRLAIGTANQELRVNSGATALEYHTPSGGGVLQLKHAHKNDTQSFGSGAVGSVSGLEVTMGVLASTSNKVKITAMVNFCAPNDGQVVIRRKVGSGSYAAILIPATSGSRSLVHASPTIRDQHEISNAFIEILDAPANATDVLKYEVYYQNAPSGSATGYINRTIEDGNNGNQERTVSTITAMEIASSIL